jgi:LPXTG-motif cell wall-anchored protein
VNPLKSSLKRTTAVLAGSLLGLVGAVALAAPASAHHADITGTPVCTTGDNWKVDWKVTNWEGGKVGKIIAVTSVPADPALTVIKVDATMESGASLTDTQAFTGAVTEASLEVTVVWESDRGRKNTNPPKDTKKAKVYKPAPCPTATPSVTPSSAPPTSTPPVTSSPSVSPSVSVSPSTSASPTPSATPSPSPTPVVPGEGGGGGTLPKTGVAVGGIAAGAGVLLALGAGLFMMARRRRVKFTA